MKSLPKDYTARRVSGRQGAVQRNGFGCKLQVGRFSKLKLRAIGPYRIRKANTFCQGPVATGWYMSRRWRGTCCRPAESRAVYKSGTSCTRDG